MKIGSECHNHQRDHHLNLELKTPIRKDPYQSIKLLVRERKFAVITIQKSGCRNLEIEIVRTTYKAYCYSRAKVKRLKRIKVILNKVKHGSWSDLLHK